MQSLVVRNLIAAGFLMLFGGLASGQNSWNFPDFAATQLFESRKASMSMKVYFSESNVRVERTDALSTIYMNSRAEVFNLTTYPDHSHQCVVMKPGQAKMLPSPLELLQGDVIQRTPIGTEMIDAHPCKIEDVIVTRADGSRIKSRVWEAEDLKGIPVRIESQIGEITLAAVYRDILVETADRGLFTIPEVCTPFEKMGQVVEEKTIR